MNATIHPVAPEELMAFLDGELPADRAQSISAHIEQCGECRALADEMQHTAQDLAAWKIGVVPPAIDNQVTVGVKSGVTPTSSNIFQRISFWGWKQRAVGLVAIGVTAVLLVAITVPNLLRSRMAARESTALTRQLDKQTKKSVDLNGTFQSKATAEPAVDGLDQLEPSGMASSTDKTPSPYISKLPPPRPASRSAKAFRKWLDEDAAYITETMIARTVALSLVVKDFDASRKSLDAILTRHNGYAAGLNVSTPQGAARSLQASLRIPAPQLAAALNELKSLGHVETESQNGEEVTQQHADLVARLKNSRETEQRLQAILVQRTGKISDVLEVEQEIARVRGEIEQMEAEQKNLEHRVDFATIDLKFADEYKAQLGSPATSVSTQFHNALVNGYTNAADSLLGLLLSLVQYGPVLLLWIVLLSSPAWVLWRRWKRASAAV
jgi:hypothetical protein